jgi:AraC family transcriptional activator of mtrCDE
MDALGLILDLVRARVMLDIRCLFGGQFDAPHADLPEGEAAFHLVLSGQCQLQLAHARRTR